MTGQLEARVATLERVAQEHEQDLQAKRGADNTLLTAIGETQSKHGQKLDAIEGKIDLLHRGQGKLSHDVEALQADMGEVKGRLGKVEDKLTTIAKTQAEHTTALAAVGTRLDAVDGRLDKMDDRLAKVDEKLDLLLNR